MVRRLSPTTLQASRSPFPTALSADTTDKLSHHVAVGTLRSVRSGQLSSLNDAVTWFLSRAIAHCCRGW